MATRLKSSSKKQAMIDISAFKDFINKTFPRETISIDEYKPDLQFAEIDCFPDQPVKLAIEVSLDSVKLSTISREPSIDLSLYEYSFEDISEAEKFVLQIRDTGPFPKKNSC
jgi:hypothetical protein